MARLRAAGAVIVGKATTHEFALGVTSPQSRNPHDPTRIPGGSSGGSAITVATGMALGSLGTDTRASIRVPAALSGVVGFKPTFGAVPDRRASCRCRGRWTTSRRWPARWPTPPPCSRRARRRRTAHRASGSTRRVDGWRIGVATVDTRRLRARGRGRVPRRARRVCRALGCRVGRDRRRPPTHDLEEANAGRSDRQPQRGRRHSTARSAASSTATGPRSANSSTAAGIACSPSTTSTRSGCGRTSAHRLLDVFDAIDDLLAMPTVPVVAPPVDDFARYLMVLSRNAIPWSFLGFPASRCRAGRSLAGLPIGIQFVGPPTTTDRSSPWRRLRTRPPRGLTHLFSVHPPVSGPGGCTENGQGGEGKSARRSWGCVP